MQFHHRQQPKFITLGNRSINVYAITDILPFQVETSNQETTPAIFHKVGLISGDWLKVFDNEGKETIEAILKAQGVNVETLRKQANL